MKCGIKERPGEHKARSQTARPNNSGQKPGAPQTVFVLDSALPGGEEVTGHGEILTNIQKAQGWETPHPILEAVAMRLPP